MARKMHAVEVDVDSALVRRLIRRQFPHWSDLSVTAVPSPGTVNVIYRLGDHLAVRLPRTLVWAGDLERELEWLPRLAPHLPLAVPQPVARGEPDTTFPLRWAVYRWLEGRAFDPTTANDQDTVARDLAAFIIALRSVDPGDGPRSPRDRPLEDLDAGARAAIQALAGLIDTAAATAAWDASLQAAPWEGPPVWTHGDLLPPNLFRQQDHLAAVIDFGCVGVGDPAIDVIPAWTVLSAAGRSWFRRALDVEEETWARARGRALHQALLIVPYYLDTNPAFAALARRTIDHVLQDSAQ